jgi:4'-phosphopantetheinyl transferase
LNVTPAELSPALSSKGILSKLPINNVAPPGATLWLVNGDSVEETDIEFFTQRLGESETRRLVSFLRPQRRRQFVLGRMLLRFAVSDLTGYPVHAIGVVERPSHSPWLILPDSQSGNPRFSLSHSRNWVACAVSCAAAVGLDIEVNDPARDIDGISEMLFHPSERLWLSSLSHAERVTSFYSLWCEREAQHKLLCNLGRDPDLSSDAASRIGCFTWRCRIQSLSALSVVAVSDRRLFGIQKKILTALTRADWSNGFTCKFEEPFDKLRVNGQGLEPLTANNKPPSQFSTGQGR